MTKAGRTIPGARLAVTRLRLTDFRCYRAADVPCDGRTVVLTGPNGAGKTNVLEALSYLSPGRGLRRAPLTEVTRRDAPPGAVWAVAARLATGDGETAIGTGIDPEAPPGSARRLVRVDGTSVPSQAVLGDHMAVVWLTPAMDRLFADTATGRRRFLDRLVYGFEPGHAREVSGYEQAMRERSRLLRTGRADPHWLSALEETMARRAVSVAVARLALMDRLEAAHATASYGGGAINRGDAFPRAAMAVTGTVEEWLRDRPALEAEDGLKALLRRNRALDAHTGGATEGIHRSDLAVSHRVKGIEAAQCSTGEQKALLIGIVLANARLIAALRGQPPILLLDEVVAHLDRARRRALFDEIEDLDAQAWLTGTEPALFDGLSGRAQFLAVDDGCIAEDPQIGSA